LVYQKFWKHFFPFPYPLPKKGNFFKFIWGNSLFFFLDLYNAGQQERIPFKIQIDWLKKELQQNRGDFDFCFLIMHNSIYCTGEFGCDPDLETLLLPIIKQNQIDVVISGHAHIFEAIHRTDINPPNGTLFLVCGGGGEQLDEILLKHFPFPTVPYRWQSPKHQAQRKLYSEGFSNSRFRNDKIIKNYQELGEITQHFVKFQVIDQSLTISTIKKDGTVIYEKELKKKKLKEY
jgi:hypothetical protein